MVAESEILRKVYTIISNHILHDQSMSYGVSNERASNSESVGVSFERFWPKYRFDPTSLLKEHYETRKKKMT